MESRAVNLQFSKFQGLGNDFLLIDARRPEDCDAGGETVPGLDGEAARRLCDRRFGVGGDGVILALPPRAEGDLRMRIFNADGSEAEMCGNGIRCLARFLALRDGRGSGHRWRVETAAGMIVPQLLGDGSVLVDMGPPQLAAAAVPTTLEVGTAGLPQGWIEAGGERFAVAAAGMGNPHVVIPVEELGAVNLEGLGPLLESHPAFPARANVHFVQVLHPGHLVMRVWERGAGVTLACGTGACATLVAAHLLGLSDRQARVDLPGGTLQITWDEESGHVLMGGPAEPVFDGILTASLLSEPAISTAAIGEADTIDCATACVNGCIRPEACASQEARARVEDLLQQCSLDELVDLAAQSAESRTRARLLRDAGLEG